MNLLYAAHTERQPKWVTKNNTDQQNYQATLWNYSINNSSVIYNSTKNFMNFVNAKTKLLMINLTYLIKTWSANANDKVVSIKVNW